MRRMALALVTGLLLTGCGLEHVIPPWCRTSRPLWYFLFNDGNDAFGPYLTRPECEKNRLEFNTKSPTGPKCFLIN
jgi:hypothetical protein